MTKSNRFISYIFTIVMAAAGIGLSAVFQRMGLPNYHHGATIAVVLVCYLFGLVPAIICYIISFFGVVFLLSDPIARFTVASGREAVSMITATIILVVICGILTRLRVVRETLEKNYEELQQTRAQLEEVQRGLQQDLKHEAHIAKELQTAFLPGIPEWLNHYQFDAVYEAGSAEAEVGGDFFDVFQLADRKVALVIGDVSGKGLQGARTAAAVRYTLQFCGRQQSSPAKCMNMLNRFLLDVPELSGFVTLFYGILDTEEKTITYCNAGHEPPIVRKADSGETTTLGPTGPLAGVIPGAAYQESTAKLDPGDAVLLYTDGLSDARPQNNLILGEEGLRKLLAEAFDKKDDHPLEFIINGAKQYAGGIIDDDVAAVLVRVTDHHQKP